MWRNGYLDEALCFPRQADGCDDRGVRVGCDYYIHAEGAVVHSVQDFGVKTKGEIFMKKLLELLLPERLMWQLLLAWQSLFWLSQRSM